MDVIHGDSVRPQDFVFVVNSNIALLLFNCNALNKSVANITVGFSQLVLFK